MKEALAEVQQHLQAARKAASTGQLQEALSLADAATAAAEALTPAEGDEAQQNVTAEARGAAFAERGLLLQRAGDAARAHEAYVRAEAEVRKLPFENGKPHYRLLVATTVINLAGLLTKQRKLGEAEAKIADALALLEAAEDAGPAAKVLTVGALQNRAAIETERKDGAAVERSLRAALEIGEGLVSAAPQLLAQLVEVSGRLAAAIRARGGGMEAVEVAERAARWAEAAYEAGSPIGLPLYVNTQLQLVDANFAATRFAQAEDHLWKAVDTAPGPQTILVGTGFYCSLLRKDDDTLATGGLPREEVVDALDELIERMRAANPPAELLQLVEVRRSVLVDRDLSAGRSAVDGADTSGNQVIGQLVAALKSDLKWLEDSE